MKRVIAVLALLLTALVVSPQQANADYSWAVTKYGYTGGNVQGVQYLLTARGISTTADGSFGPTTQANVKSFQSKSGLEVDGVVGPDTWGKLITTVKQGSTGSAVKAAQAMLNKYGYGLSIDGSFGPATYNATVAFQKRFGLSVDGVIGPNTWRYLSAAPTGSSSGWSLPISKSVLPRSEYDDPHHDYPALDLPVGTGTHAYAMTKGTATAIYTSSCGNGVRFDLSDGSRIVYCHFSKHAFSGSKSVSAGTLVGYTGSTGNSTGPHLHVSVYDSAGRYRCPQNLMLAIYDGRSVPSIGSLPTSGCSY